jgi:hypothetical protein
VRLRVVIVLSLLMAGPATAIIVSNYSVATNPPTGSWNVNWDYVYNYQGSSGVAVGSNWLLTAAHVADDSFSTTLNINGTNYYQREIVFHRAEDDPAHTNKADLALVRFDKVFPGYYPLYTGTFPTRTFPTDKRLSAVLVGFGTTGSVYNAVTDYYTDSGFGNGIKRWGSNKIDAPTTADYDVAGATGMTYNDGIQILFTFSSTTYEAGVGVRDSGGGTFVNDVGVWKLAGINTVRYGGPINLTGLFAISVPAYASWATNVMNPAGDLDGDGIPNYWEQQYGTTTGLTASADTDNDKFSNFQEYLADTNPTNEASFFEMNGFMASEVQTVYFTGSTTRQYQVFYTTNDLAATNVVWIAAHTNRVWGAGVNSAITVTNTQEKAFYRLRVTQP